MNWEGFFRSLQGDFMAVVFGLVAFGAAYWIYKFLFSAYTDPGVMKILKKTLQVAVVLVLAGFVGRALVVGFVNRMPRQDVDKSPVYEQMDSHTKDSVR